MTEFELIIFNLITNGTTPEKFRHAINAYRYAFDKPEIAEDMEKSLDMLSKKILRSKKSNQIAKNFAREWIHYYTGKDPVESQPIEDFVKKREHAAKSAAKRRAKKPMKDKQKRNTQFSNALNKVFPAQSGGPGVGTPNLDDAGSTPALGTISAEERRRARGIDSGNSSDERFYT